MKNKHLFGILATIVFILCIPLVAMQFTDQVVWTPFDFIAMGILLLGTGLAIEFVARKIRDKKTRIFLIVGILIALFLAWAELAVGIFGTPFAGS